MTVILPPQPVFGKPVTQAPSPDTLRFLAARRSSSAVTLAAPGPSDAELDQLLHLAARVPDHGKLAPWRFIVLDAEGKAAFAAKLEALAHGRGDTRAAAKLVKLKTPPMGVAVISRETRGDIPAWEQQLSAGAACTNLLYAAIAMGYGANWITDWYAYDRDAATILGLADNERVAGYVFIGTPNEPPLERERPNVESLISRWRG
ncbi:MAG: nitroreductase [Phenylobacterium sp.]|uniref:nitroreductase family protein n=1 Tax=Phenylobacterium sp. TaxID=1871053 RepID=UPI002735B1D5|nr:nitroreductase [Phenylobacterium sp.]MDP3175139.1 nitroreductase [Phenylobacterium sp.]